MKKSALLVVVAIIILHAFAWLSFNAPQITSPWYGSIEGVSFSPYRQSAPENKKQPSAKDIDQDLATLAPFIKNIRIYSSLPPLDVVPKLASKYGLEVTAGAWISQDLSNNQKELDQLIQLIRENDNIKQVEIGNEAILRGDVTVDQLNQYIIEAKQRISELNLDYEVLVSTAETHDSWRRFPELGKEVDFVTVHLLPYWDGVSIDEAMNLQMRIYQKIQSLYPDKKILVGEVGWPSQGSQKGASVPSPTNQDRFIREWLNTAKEQNINYFIIEAFDQPWKKSNEGSAGPYWGIFDAKQNLKLNFSSSSVANNPTWVWQMGISSFLGLLGMLFFIRSFKKVNLIGTAIYCSIIQACATLLITSSFVPNKIYFTLPGMTILVVMLTAQIALLIVVLINAFELTELLWRKDWDRTFKPLENKDREKWPKVSIHLACYNEPSDLVIQTLNQLAKMDYPNFEVLVIDNNTPDESVWLPLKEHCKTLGQHFRFFHIEPWGGFKAGALNFGVDMTDPEAEMIAVIDADYLVETNWLKSLIPYFDNKKVGFVQAPQDHREWQNDTFKTMINWEYAGFFNIGMVHRNERNAIIQHGTMTIIRKSVLQESGNWGEWCICEDTELGLRMMELGYESIYVNHVFGRGVVPDSFTAYKTQRFRWAYGAVQILRRYWKDLLPLNKSGLTPAQKFYFVSGWLPWFADALHLVFSIGAIFWGLGLLLAPQYFEFPLPIFLFSVVFLFLVKLGTGFILYTALVPCNFKQRIGALLAGVALTHVVGRAIIAGLINPVKPFLRTPKGENKPSISRGFLMAQEESILWIIMWFLAAANVIFYGSNLSAVLQQAFQYGIQDAMSYGFSTAFTGGVHIIYDFTQAIFHFDYYNGFQWLPLPEWKEARYWSILLIIQSIPYFASLALSLINVFPNKKHLEDSSITLKTD